MAVWSVYDTNGAKEDVSDVISNISPTKTPFQSMIGTEKIHQKLHQWQEDTLRAVATNAQLEGFTASENTPTATTVRNNATQILSETVKVSGTADATDFYGRAKESAYQLAKSMAQVKRDLENALVGISQAKVDSGLGTARKMASFQAQLLNGGSGSLDSDDFVQYTGSTSQTPRESDLLTVLNNCYTFGAEPSVVMVTPTNSQVIADFAKASGRYRTIENSGGKDRTTIVNVVDLYVSPYGQQRVVLNRFVKSKNTLVFEPDMWKLLVLRPWFRETLAKTGDNTSQMIVGEMSLKHRNFQASGAIVEAAGPTGF
jgi:hypothetical protein